MNWLRRAIRALDGLVWPSGVVCLLCDERAEDGLLCRECAARLAQYRIPEQSGPVRSAYLYTREAKRLVTSLKYDAMADAGALLAQTMAEEARSMALPPDTVVTWVGMPFRRRLVRGIDHGRTLCERVGAELGLPVRELLVRTRSTRTQRGLNRAERLTNLQGVFACREKVDRPVLLVDDVMTTGTTIRLCSEALISSGAPVVYALTAARVQSRADDDTI